jgi:hypothetical protein
VKNGKNMAHHSSVLGRLEAGGPPVAVSPKRWTWMFPVLAFAPLAAAALWYFPVRISQGASTVALRADLSLRLQKAGSDYRVVWNADSPAVAAARRGTLFIKDGDFEKELELDREQLLNAGMLYSPATPDVSFRLAVYGQDPEPTVETVRLLAGSRPEPAAALPPADDVVVVTPAQGTQQQEPLPAATAAPAPQEAQTVASEAPADTAAAIPAQAQPPNN